MRTLSIKLNSSSSSVDNDSDVDVGSKQQKLPSSPHKKKNVLNYKKNLQLTALPAAAKAAKTSSSLWGWLGDNHNNIYIG